MNEMKRVLIIIAGTLAWFAVLALFAVSFHIASDWRIKIEGVPDGEAAVECGGDFTPPAVTAAFYGNILFRGGVPLTVAADGAVDASKVGEYVLRWRTSAFGTDAEAEYRVSVVDTTPPVITLVPEEREFILPGTAYDDPGFAAADIADGDITDRVRVDTEDDGKTLTLRYTVADSSGNGAEAERTVRYDDPIPPEIALLGDAEISFYAGREVFSEPGFTASDNVLGDIADRVKVEGEVDSGTPGTYVIKYSVEDDYGNRAEAVRTVTVVEPPKPRTVTVQKDYPVDGPIPDRVIYLTFDDGPGAYTAELLDVLKKHNVRATFFVTGNGDPSLIAREEAEGHSVGIHTMTHDYYSIYSSEEAFFADVWAINEIIKEQTGSYTTLLRFPGGSSNTVSRFNPGIMTRLTAAVVEAGFTYFDWNVTSGDAGGTTDTREVFLNVTGGISGKSAAVVLQHDIKGFSVAAVDDIIEWGLANGYVFLPLTPCSPTARHRVNN